MLDELAILMTMCSIQPLQFLLTLLAGWINRRQLEAIDYLKEENRLLKERLGGRRLRFTDVERRRLARRALSELDTLVTPDTLMRWYRTLVAQKWTYTHRRGPGRPRTIQVIVQLIIRMALENRTWGYTRIQGALANLGHDVGRGTIANVLSEHGIDPAPERGKRTSWSTFLKAHWDSIAATDFFTVEVLTLRGLVTYYVLFGIDLASRTVKIAGITSHPDEAWMMQIARNLTDADEPFLRRTRFLIMDRDTKYSAAFRAALTRERIEPIRLVFFSRSSLERALTHYVAHYHEERNHQGLQNRLLKRSDGPIDLGSRVGCRERLGGMLNFYHREAA